MLENIKLGLSDIKKNKYYFIAIIAYLTIFLIVSLMLITTIKQHVDELKNTETEETLKVTITPLTYDLNFKPEYIDMYGSILSDKAVTYLPTNLYMEDIYYSAYVIIGDSSLLNIPESKNSISVVTFADNYPQSIDLNGKIIEVEKINLNDSNNQHYIIDNELLYLIYNKEQIESALKKYVSIDNQYFFELLLNTKIPSTNQSGLLQLKSLESQLVNIYVDDNILNPSLNKNQHIAFTYYFLLPLVLLIVIVGVISFDNVFKSILTSMKRELTIHLQSGAHKIALQIIFMTFYFSLFFISIMIDLLLIKFLRIESIVINLLIILLNTIMFLICVLYIRRSLNKINLFDNLRGDYS